MLIIGITFLVMLVVLYWTSSNVFVNHAPMYRLGYFLIAGILFGTVILLFLEKMVFSRVTFLSRSVGTIATQSDVGQRIIPKGKDELTSLTQSINEMLDAIEGTEGELQESEERYRDLFENASDFVYLLDLKGNFTSVNAALAETIGYPRATLETMNVAQIVAPDHLELLGQMLRKKIVGRTVTTYELDVIKKDGERQNVEVSSRPIFQAGHVVGIHGIARNITARKELERKSKELSDLKDDLTRMLVHDFKNPMTVISGYLDLMEKRQTDNPEALRWINQMKLAAFAMKQMVSNLLDISRLESATFNLAVERFSLTRLINEALAETDFIAKNKGVTFHHSLEQDFEMTGDSMVLKRVLTNLVNNAIKHTPSGKNIFVAGEYVEKTDFFEGPGVRVVVRDEGEGIMGEHLYKIFDKYWTTTTAGKGTGLGLAFCRMAIESQKGSLWVESEPGKGSVFSFIIPKDLPLKSGNDDNPQSVSPPEGERSSSR
ncbi:MAG: PAS domain S-box protein [Acidobacteriia bacterium]|nr:PAS domain S-box protein [Terriglobia bacterium]